MRLPALVLSLAILAVPPGLAVAQPAGESAPSYFVERQGQPEGPLSLAQVLERIRDGEVTAATRIWRSGDADWRPAGEDPGLRGALTAEAPVPPPLPPSALPPPLPAAPSVAWYVERQGRAEGPLSQEAVLEQLRSGRITPRTQIWRSGDPSWQAADEHPELRAAFAGQPPPVTGLGTFHDFLAGTWHYRRALGMGMRRAGELRYGADGRFSGIQTVAYPGGPPVTQPVAGGWEVRPIGAPDRFALVVYPDGGYPVTVVLRILDKDTVFNETEGFPARRVGP